MNAKLTTMRLLFSGDVQGVGFRYTTERYASALQLAGTVKNLPDGAVELIAQGEKEQIDKLISQVKNRFKNHIQHVDLQVIEQAVPYTHFRIIS